MFDRALGADSFYTPVIIDSVALSSPESMVAELPLSQGILPSSFSLIQFLKQLFSI